MVIVGPAGFDEDVERISLGQGVLLSVDCVHQVLGIAIHELECTENLGELLFGLYKSLAGMVKALDATVGDIDCQGLQGTLDGDAGDDTDGAFATDEQLLHVVARVVLPQRAQVVDDRAVGQNGFHAEHSAMQGSITE